MCRHLPDQAHILVKGICFRAASGGVIELNGSPQFFVLQKGRQQRRHVLANKFRFHANNNQPAAIGVHITLPVASDDAPLIAVFSAESG